MSEKVGMERLIHEGTQFMKVHWMARRQSLVSQSGNFEVNPGTDWEPMKPVHEVLNRRST